MDEGIIFIGIMAGISIAWCSFLQYCPTWCRRITLGIVLAYALLMEWNMLSLRLGSTIFGFCDVEVFPRGSDAALWLYTLCTVAVFVLLLLPFIRPLRRRWAPGVARWLFLAGFSLIPLQMALYMDTFFPFFGGPAGMGFSLVTAAVVLFQLLHHAAILGLTARLGSYGRKKR